MQIDKALRRIFFLFLFLFLLVAANLTYLQVIRASQLTHRQENPRELREELSFKRGSIYSADGKILAQSIEEDGKFKRIYPYREIMEPFLGFTSPIYWKSGVEKSFDQYLLQGLKDPWPLQLIKDLQDTPEEGDSLYLTIDSRLQEIAFASLDGQKGAILALDPQTGAILAMVSRPSFDPNELERNWEQLANDKDSPLVNRPANGLYTPGSVFKILTSAAALDSGSAGPGTTYECKESIVVQGNIIRNYGGKGYGNIDLTQAFKISCNTYFAQLALELGREHLKEYVKRFGFDRKPSLQFDAAASFFPDTSEMDDVELAWSGIGQGKMLVTPLQIAMVGLAMANQGRIMEPYLVQEIRNSRDGLVKRFEPRIYAQPISAQTAEEVKAMMVKVVAEGTGRSAQIQGVSVAGKTGTAELGEGKKPHSWFVGFAPSQRPRILMVVMVENGGTGAEMAAPIFKKVASAYLGP